MSVKLGVVTIGLALLIVPLRAETIEITATGTITQFDNDGPGFGNFDSSVQVGAPFSNTYTIDSNAPENPAQTPSPIYNSFEDFSGTAAVSVGDYSYSGSGLVSADIFSGIANLYGYDFASTCFSNLTTPDGEPIIQSIFALYSKSTPAVSPTSSLSSIQEFPVSDFNDDSQFTFYLGQGGVAWGKITSYSVTFASVPEPSSSSFLAVTCILIACLLRLKRKA